MCLHSSSVAAVAVQYGICSMSESLFVRVTVTDSCLSDVTLCDCLVCRLFGQTSQKPLQWPLSPASLVPLQTTAQRWNNVSELWTSFWGLIVVMLSFLHFKLPYVRSVWNVCGLHEPKLKETHSNKDNKHPALVEARHSAYNYIATLFIINVCIHIQLSLTVKVTQSSSIKGAL